MRRPGCILGLTKRQVHTPGRDQTLEPCAQCTDLAVQPCDDESAIYCCLHLPRGAQPAAAGRSSAPVGCDAQPAEVSCDAAQNDLTEARTARWEGACLLQVDSSDTSEVFQGCRSWRRSCFALSPARPSCDGESDVRDQCMPHGRASSACAWHEIVATERERLHFHRQTDATVACSYAAKSLCKSLCTGDRIKGLTILGSSDLLFLDQGTLLFSTALTELHRFFYCKWATRTQPCQLYSLKGRPLDRHMVCSVALQIACRLSCNALARTGGTRWSFV